MAPAPQLLIHTVAVGYHSGPAYLCVQVLGRRLPEPSQEANPDEG